PFDFLSQTKHRRRSAGGGSPREACQRRDLPALRLSAMLLLGTSYLAVAENDGRPLTDYERAELAAKLSPACRSSGIRSAIPSRTAFWRISATRAGGCLTPRLATFLAAPGS